MQGLEHVGGEKKLFVEEIVAQVQKITFSWHFTAISECWLWICGRSDNLDKGCRGQQLNYQDLADHGKLGRPYKILTNGVVGRYMVAVRDIKAGEVRDGDEFRPDLDRSLS